MHLLLRREDHTDNVKRICSQYREDGLSPHLNRPRHYKAAKLRQTKQLARAINEIWSMDFVADALFDGRELCMVTVVDRCASACLAIQVGQRLEGQDVVRTLDAPSAQRGLPRTIKTDFWQRVHAQGDGQVGPWARGGARLQCPGSPRTTPRSSASMADRAKSA